jgi:hypothetical protein
VRARESSKNRANVETILSNRRYRKFFYILSLLLLVVLLLVRYLLVPTWDPNISGNWAKALAQLTEGLTTSLIVTILIGSFLFFVTPAVMKIAKIEPVDPKTINDLLNAATATSTAWTLRGAMGRYTRAETLPAIIKRARFSGGRRRLRLMVLDPDNARACRGYAAFRNGVAYSSKAESPFTETTVRNQILATILAATKASLTESMIDIQIYLVPMWSVVRIDLSDEYAILTSEDPREPGLRVDRGSQFYGTYTRELDLVALQSRSLPHLDSSSDLLLASASHAKAVLQYLGIAHDDLSQERCEEIFQLINSKSHQYA